MTLRIASARLLRHATALVALIAITGIARAEDPCPEGFPRTADLGLRQLDGNISISLKRVQSDPLVIRKVYKFYEEPRVTSVDPAGPSMGRLKAGDILVAIDGALITTSEAGRKIGALDPDQPVKITIRRDGRTMDVKVRPRSRCPDDQLADVYRAIRDRESTPRPPRAPRAPRAPQSPDVVVLPRTEYTPLPEGFKVPIAPMAPMPPGFARRSATRGWFGIGLSCGDCGWATVNDSMVYRTNEYPKIYMVEEGSPADKGGLQRGDMLTHINGVSLLTDEGGHAFGAVKPGQPVRWTFEREGETRSAMVVAGVRPGQVSQYERNLEKLQKQLGQIEGLDQEELRRQVQQMQEALDQSRRTPGARQKVRYVGSVGDAEVTVQGQSNVSVSTDEETGEMVITTGETTIRIKKSAVNKKGDK